MRSYKENNTTVNGGIGFVGLLTIVFIALKLLGYIKWSWVWVLSPIWIELLLVIIGFVIYAAVVLIRSNSRKRKAERYKRARESMEKAKGVVYEPNAKRD